MPKPTVLPESNHPAIETVLDQSAEPGDVIPSLARLLLELAVEPAGLRAEGRQPRLAPSDY